MLPPPPPRRQVRDELKPAAACGLAASRAQLRHLSAAAIGHLHTDQTGSRADRDRLTRNPRPAMPDAGSVVTVENNGMTAADG
jgi:hypothetical protein